MGKLTDRIKSEGFAYVRIGSPEYVEARKLEQVGAVTIRHYSGTMWIVRKVNK